MMENVIIKFHELALKGKNRPMFIRRLSRNLKQAVRGTGVKQVWQGHMLIGVAQERMRNGFRGKVEEDDCWST